LRFVSDELGFGVEIEGLAGPEIVYLAGKPKDALPIGGEQPKAEVEARNHDSLKVVCCRIFRHRELPFFKRFSNPA
jgi:hypothetical protein